MFVANPRRVFFIRLQGKEERSGRCSEVEAVNRGNIATTGGEQIAEQIDKPQAKCEVQHN